MLAPSPVERTLRTSPTTSPRSLTSAGAESWLPARSAFSVTCTTAVNALL